MIAMVSNRDVRDYRTGYADGSQNRRFGASAYFNVQEYKAGYQHGYQNKGHFIAEAEMQAEIDREQAEYDAQVAAEQAAQVEQQRQKDVAIAQEQSQQAKLARETSRAEKTIAQARFNNAKSMMAFWRKQEAEPDNTKKAKMGLNSKQQEWLDGWDKQIANRVQLYNHYCQEVKVGDQEIKEKMANRINPNDAYDVAALSDVKFPSYEYPGFIPKNENPEIECEALAENKVQYVKTKKDVVLLASNAEPELLIKNKAWLSVQKQGDAVNPVLDFDELMLNNAKASQKQLLEHDILQHQLLFTGKAELADRYKLDYFEQGLIAFTNTHSMNEKSQASFDHWRTSSETRRDYLEHLCMAVSETRAKLALRNDLKREKLAPVINLRVMGVYARLQESASQQVPDWQKIEAKTDAEIAKTHFDAVHNGQTMVHDYLSLISDNMDHKSDRTYELWQLQCGGYSPAGALLSNPRKLDINKKERQHYVNDVKAYHNNDVDPQVQERLWQATKEFWSKMAKSHRKLQNMERTKPNTKYSRKMGPKLVEQDWQPNEELMPVKYNSVVAEKAYEAETRPAKKQFYRLGTVDADGFAQLRHNELFWKKRLPVRSKVVDHITFNLKNDFHQYQLLVRQVYGKSAYVGFRPDKHNSLNDVMKLGCYHNAPMLIPNELLNRSNRDHYQKWLTSMRDYLEQKQMHIPLQENGTKIKGKEPILGDRIVMPGTKTKLTTKDASYSLPLADNPLGKNVNSSNYTRRTAFHSDDTQASPVPDDNEPEF